MLVPGDPARRTGGSLYDARIAEGLQRAGRTIQVHGLPGRFPFADDVAREAFDRALAGVPDAGVAILDGLALGGLPDLAEAHSSRIELVALIHHPLCDETGLDAEGIDRLLRLETRALAACRRIITTSRFTRERLVELGMDRAPTHVVEPGTDPAPLAESPTRFDHRHTPILLCVGSLVPRKGQDVLVQALQRLEDRAWRCVLAGHPGRDPAFTARLDSMIERAGLADRIDRAGELDDPALQRAYLAADLFVLPSHYEGFGMVVTEALARGLPVITTTGGALARTLPEEAGLHVPPADAEALAGALARWLDDPGLRDRLRQGARRVRDRLPGWDDAAARFLQALETSAASRTEDDAVR